MRGAAGTRSERAGSTGNAGRYRIALASGRANADGRLEAWVDRQSNGRRRRRAGSSRSEGTRDLQFARTRGGATGEVPHSPTVFLRRRRDSCTGKGAATEQEPAGADVGGIAAGGVMRVRYRQD